MRQRRLNAWTLALGLLGVCQFARSAPPVFPADPATDSQRFGLFIGINSYSNLPDNQLRGCVQDATAMHDIFARNFGFKRTLLLTDPQTTTCSYLAETLRALVENVKTARAKLGAGKPITVVICYAGHGEQVERLPEENDSSKDDSWVASDGKFDGSNNIRGYDLRKIYTALSREGAQTIVFSDSCCSGSMYRGATSYAVREISPPDGKLAPGSSKSLFPELTITASPGQKDWVLPGFVLYAAAAEDQPAGENILLHRGLFSTVVEGVLQHLDANHTSYAGLACAIATRFAAENQGSEQTPTFHAAAGKADELFIKGGFAPTYAAIIPNTIQGNQFQITLGQIDGVTKGSRLTFYKNLADLAAAKNPLATALVDSANLKESQVHLENTAPPIDATAVGRLDSIQMHDFSVAIDDKLPQSLKDKIAALNGNKQLRLVPATTSYDALVYYDAPSQAVALFPMSARPTPGVPLHKLPRLRPWIQYTGSADDERVAQNLLYAARVKRFLSLENNALNPPTAEVLIQNAKGALTPAPRGADGIPLLHPGDNFVIRLTNPASFPVYPTVFSLDMDGALELQLPQPLEPAIPIAAGKYFDLGGDNPFIATIDNKNLPAGAAERTIMKVFTSQKEIDFSPLTVAPETGAKNVTVATRGPKMDDPLFDLIRDAAHGGAATRGATRPMNTPWSAVSVTFDVVNPAH